MTITFLWNTNDFFINFFKIPLILLVCCALIFTSSIPVPETHFNQHELQTLRNKRTIIFRPLFLYREEQEKRMKLEGEEEHRHHEDQLLQQNNNDNDYVNGNVF